MFGCKIILTNFDVYAVSLQLDISSNGSGFKTEQDMKVIKRSGHEENLTKKKIYDSIVKANECVEEDCRLTRKQIQRITDSVFDVCQDMEEPIPIDKIEDMIEKKLMEASGYEVAKKYITYRYEKERVRNNQHLTEKLMAKNVANQNANMDEFSFTGRIGEAASYVMKEYALNNLMSKMARDNHLNNEIYIHDLDHYAIGDHNCLSIPFDKLLANGFDTRQADVRPASSINTALQLVAVIFQLQSLQQFGGVAATHLDWTLVPYVRKSFKKHFLDGLKYVKQVPFERVEEIKEKLDDYQETNPRLLKIGAPVVRPIDDPMYVEFDREQSPCDGSAKEYAFDMTVKETVQAIEGMYHNLNTLQSRTGGQLPFTSINYGTCTLCEGQLVITALLEGSIKGVGKFHKTSIFPCGIFQCQKGVNLEPEDPNYKLFRVALESTSTRLYPNYANVDWTGNAGYDPDDPRTYFSTMGCRTANGVDINAEPGQNPQMKDGRGNICPTTIIMPTLAMEAVEQTLDELARGENKDQIPTLQNFIKEAVLHSGEMTVEEIYAKRVDTFMKLLDKKIHEAKDMLLERFDWISSQPAKSAKFMYENGLMLGYKPEEGIRSALKHGTIVIGQLGLAETLQILIGTDHTTEEGMKVAKRIEQLFKDRCAEFKKQYKLNFGVYFTPAENLCHTAMKKFRAKYGVIKDVSDKDYFTNSMHVPVWKKMNPFEKIDIEAQLTGYSNAGCITYVETDSATKNNIDALETLVKYAMEKDLPYFAINVPSDTCQDCGYQGEINGKCPVCGSGNIQRLRRVTGYLTGDYKTAFNVGKQNEVEMRVRHNGICVDE